MPATPRRKLISSGRWLAVALAVENALIFDELGPFRDNAYKENARSKGENGGEQVFEGIVGNSSALIPVLREFRGRGTD